MNWKRKGGSSVHSPICIFKFGVKRCFVGVFLDYYRLAIFFSVLEKEM